MSAAWPQLLSAALGVWLMAAPAVLAYDGTPADLHRILGPVAAAFAIVASWAVTRPVRWANVPIGLAVAGAPLFVGHDPSAAIAAVATGLALAALSPVGDADPSRFGGGWSSLVSHRGR